MASDEALSSEARAHTKQLFADKVSEQRTVVIKGLGKHMLLSALCTHLEPAGSIEEVKRVRKTAFVTYSTAAQAALAIERLNNRELQGQPLQIFLLGGPGWEPPSMQAVMETDAIYASGHGDGPAEGVGVNDPEIASSSTATTMHTDASIAQGDASALHGNVRGDPARKQVSENKVSEHEGPHEQGHARGFTGVYLTKLLQLWRQKRNKPAALALLNVVTAPRSSQTKELCESVGVVRALFDFGAKCKLDLMKKKALVFVPGDGNRPNTAAALCLQVPDSWLVYSIDPVLKKFEASTLADAASRLFVVPTKLEDFEVPPHQSFDMYIILAVHCHAPLQEFWARLSLEIPALCISLPCCGDHGWLSQEPVQISRDPEIPSSKNSLYVYTRPAARATHASP